MADLLIFRPTNLLYTQENVSRYQPGGYHPVCLGDTFKDGRYRVCHKLGWGGFSTVWLAKDTKTGDWVSIKIMRADCPKPCKELRYLQSLSGRCQGNLASAYIIHLLDEFTHRGPNGIHQCLVCELLGPTLEAVLYEYSTAEDALEPEIILKLTKELLQAISFMHNAGYVHGDISGSNIAFSCSNLLSELAEEDDDEEAIMRVLGTPEIVELARRDGKPLNFEGNGRGLPKQLVKAASWIDWFDEDVEDLRIIDLGESFRRGSGPKRLAQPGSLQAPETIFTDKVDYEVDLWRAGCVIYTLIFRAPPFLFLGDINKLVQQMIRLIEDLPAEWQNKWRRMRQTTGGESNSFSPPEKGGQASRSRLEEMFDRVQDPTLKPLLPIIHGLMRQRPSDRISTSQALHLIDHASGSVVGAH